MNTTNRATRPRDLTVGEVALLWNVSTKTVRRLIAAGRLPVLRFNARVLRITAVDAAATYATLR